MKQINVFFASLALTCLAMYPVTALADDLDDLSLAREAGEFDAIGQQDCQRRGVECLGGREYKVDGLRFRQCHRHARDARVNLRDS